MGDFCFEAGFKSLRYQMTSPSPDFWRLVFNKSGMVLVGKTCYTQMDALLIGRGLLGVDESFSIEASV